VSPDVLVVGGGPAGALFAATAARAGLRTTLIDDSDEGVHRIGESLPGSALHLLKQAGFSPSGLHAPLAGSIASWGSERLERADAFREPFGAGLRLDRRAFERELRNFAQASGALLLKGKIREVMADASAMYLTTSSGTSISSRLVVDATGRSAFIARKAGARRTTDRRLFCVYRLLDPMPLSETDRLWVESADNGWWYSIALPDGMRLAAFFCDLATAQAMRATPEIWYRQLSETKLVGSAFELSTAAERTSLNVANASQERLDRDEGTGWLAVGDAACSYDPLTSQGLFAALFDGFEGARAIGHAIAGDTQPLAAFHKVRAQRRAVIAQRCAALYQGEGRWANSPFWMERRMPGAGTR